MAPFRLARFDGKRDLPYDEAVRTGTLVRGTKVVYSRVELAAVPPPGEGALFVYFTGRVDRRHPPWEGRFAPLTDTDTGGSSIV